MNRARPIAIDEPGRAFRPPLREKMRSVESCGFPVPVDRVIETST